MPNINETFDLIDNFSKLPRGWNFGEGVPACPIAVKQSKDLLRFAFDLGHKDFDAFPGIDGEVQICFYNEDDTLEITSESNGDLTVNVEKDDVVVLFEQKTSFSFAIKILKDFTYNKCLSYALLTSANTTTQEKNVSQVWRLNPQQATAVYQYLTPTVQIKQVEQLVSIFSNTTQQLPELLSSFGKSPMVES